MGANDLLEQLQAAQAQSVIDERRIAKLEARLAAAETFDLRDAERLIARLEAELRSLRGEATRLTDLVEYGPRPKVRLPSMVADHGRPDSSFAPIAELEQRPGTITPDDIRKAVAPVLVSATRYPRKVQPHILGQDMGPLIEAVVARVTALLRKDTP